MPIRMPNQVWKEEVEPETLLQHFGEESDEELDYTYASTGTNPNPSPALGGDNPEHGD